VLKLDQVRDPERLRNVAVLLDREVERLQEHVRDLTFEIARLRGEPVTQVDFGFPRQALEKVLAEETEEGAAAPRLRPAQPSHGPTPQERLPAVEQVHELPQQERRCTLCGDTLEPMKGQYEDAEEITVNERSYTLVLHRRQKYRCGCNGNVVTAPGPLKLIPGGRYSLDFAAHVAVQKYAEHLPLERQVEIMARHGLETTSQALWDQLEAAGTALRPSYEALGQWLLCQPLLHVDETGWPVNALDTQKPRWTAWCICNEQAVWFRIASTKSESEGRRLLGEYHGTVVADGYKVYKNLARDGPGYRLVHCWAHVLRKFRDTEKNDPRSRWILERIGHLYEHEREIALEVGDEVARHLELRKERLGPVLEEVRLWALSQGGPRRSDFGKAVAYMLSHWQGLTQLLEDATVPLDNGAQVSALFYSLLGTAKLRGLDPVAFLREALTASVRQPGVASLPT
jgi:transposase